MSQEPEKAVKNIFPGISVLSKLHKENTNPILLQFYFDAKSGEWASLLNDIPKAERDQYIKKLMAMDPSNADKYRKAK